MSVIVDGSTRLCTSGITGREGTFHTLNNRSYGTNVVAGVTPGKGGQDVEGIPVFNTFEEAVAQAAANTAMIFVPPPFAADSILEAAAAGIATIIAITEGIPAHDELRVYTHLHRTPGVRLIGPNCPGILSPGKANVGIIPASFFREGNVGVVSRSGTLTYQVGNELAQRGFGNSSIVGIGGDPVPGSSFVDIIGLFEADPETELIVMAGEIGGDAEEAAAEFISTSVSKPVVAYIAGFTAPPGKTMGHAGAIVSGSHGTAAAKAAALEAHGVRVGRTPTEVADIVVETLGGRAMTAQATAISFARGAPSLDIIDIAGLRDAAERAFVNDPGGMTAYGTAIGYVPLRRWVAQQHGVDESHVIITNGSMQADAFLFDELVSPGDAVVVERPSYDRTLRGLRLRGAELHAIPIEPDGIDTDALERALADGLRPTLAHIIPNFHNPAGYTLSGPKRERLLALAREHSFTLFEDDPYIALRFRGETLPRMLDLDGGAGTVVYASSFSKTVCPGIRVGYLVGAPELIAKIVVRATDTYISPSMVDAAIVHEFCRSGAIERSIETVRVALQERVEVLAAALREQIPDASFVAPDGGYFMWLTLPEGLTPAAVFDAAAQQGVAVVSGDDFVIDGASGAIRLAHSGVRPDEIREGVERLARAIDTLR